MDSYHMGKVVNIHFRITVPIIAVPIKYFQIIFLFESNQN